MMNEKQNGTWYMNGMIWRIDITESQKVGGT